MTDVTVTVRYFAAARAAAGTTSDTVTATTIAELRSVITQRHGPGLARILPACGLLINGVAGHDDRTELCDDTVVDILPPFAGG